MKEVIKLLFLSLLMKEFILKFFKLLYMIIFYTLCYKFSFILYDRIILPFKANINNVIITEEYCQKYGYGYCKYD
jgi:hypothetical protein